jgi:hypothetical protein
MLKKEKEYYSLVEIEQLVDLKTRSVKYRMVEVKKKYKDNKKLLYKGKKNWNIHKSIIFEFDRKQLSVTERLAKYNSLVTISPDGNYDIEALRAALQLIKIEMEKIDVNASMFYFIEQGERGGLNHVHFVTNITPNFKNRIYRICNIYIKSTVDTRMIYEVRQLLTYLQKEVKAQGSII